MEDEEDVEKREQAKKQRKALVDSYTDLACAFVPSLSPPELDFLFRVIKPYFKVDYIPVLLFFLVNIFIFLIK